MTSEFAKDILQTHNKYRAKHGAPDLKISDKLTKIAQEWAENLSSRDKSEHRPDNLYGENIYMAGSTDPNFKLKGETVVKSWYDEIKFHKFGEVSPKNTSEVGHFTQLVWKETMELGIGEAKSKTGKVYVVCNYDPPGNVLREFGKNVLPLDKTVQDENDNRQSMEDTEETKRERIELTESLKKIGIRFVEPNIQVIESMKRLYAVPSEKIRVWSVWLTKIEEEANEWHCWLRSHINLVLRMSEYLQKAQEEVEKEKKLRDEGISVERERASVETSEQDASMGEQKRQVDGLDKKRDESEVEKSLGAADAGQILEETPEEIPNINNESNSEKTQLSSASMSKEMEETTGNEEVLSSEVGEEPSKPEPMESLSERSETLLKGENNEDTNDDRNRDEETKSSNGEGEKEKATEGLEKIAWPIGVPWEPVATTLMEEKEVAEKKDDEVKVIPIPANEEDMLKLIRDVKRQATIYESFYKHWLEVSDRAVKEIMNREVMPSERVPTAEEIPYFFYLYVEPDIDIAVDNDDETILLPDPTREKITGEFTNLYFNLADKPGKGGEPWL